MRDVCRGARTPHCSTAWGGRAGAGEASNRGAPLMAAQERQLPGWVLPTAAWQRCLRGRLALRPERRLVRTPRRRARRPRHFELHTPPSLSLSSDARA
eukprot:ctg_2437.g442